MSPVSSGLNFVPKCPAVSFLLIETSSARAIARRGKEAIILYDN